ncbi:cathelicidin-2-like [Tiliqua scincoides]|uniref:cathelicidin-2-like n=1 Tax=Tiliqua scincoides TaxID=71010 RepID=UPI00346206F9
MESSWALLLLVGLVTAAPTESPKATEEALSRFIEIYNQGPNVQNAFRVFQARPQPAQSSGSGTLLPLNFTIQETVCPATKKAVIEQCEFKPDGIMKDCSGYFSTKQANSLIVVTCNTVQGEEMLCQHFNKPFLKLEVPQEIAK